MSMLSLMISEITLCPATMIAGKLADARGMSPGQSTEVSHKNGAIVGFLVRSHSTVTLMLVHFGRSVVKSNLKQSVSFKFTRGHLCSDIRPIVRVDDL